MSSRRNAYHSRMDEHESDADGAESLDDVIAAFSDDYHGERDGRRLFDAPPIDPPDGCDSDDRPIDELF